jgi:PRC-barrel domain protein
MLKSLKECLGYSIKATDGEIGQAIDFLVDDDLKLRYLVIDTGGWLSGKKVALSTAWISSVQPDKQVVVMNIDRKRIQEGPGYSEEHVLDRDYETRLHEHYRYPPYWIV